MSDETNPFLPPIEPALYRTEPFAWCQITYLFARELIRGGKLTNIEEVDKYNEAVSEAEEVTRVMRDGEAVMAPAPWLAPQGYVGDIVWGYTDLVYWPAMVCAANIYGSLEPGARQRVRDRIASGVPPVYVLAESGGDMSSGGCDAKVLADEEYLPAPPCLPAKASQGFWIAAGAFACTLAAMSALDTLSGLVRRGKK
ncbi:MAG: hypothetical protein WC565_04235 [Parcubacteria group bacterium]